jgi:hypothetical protein
MGKIRAFFTLLALTLGALAIVAGEKDDSPGLQGIGLILIVSSIIKLRQIWRNGGIKL